MILQKNSICSRIVSRVLRDSTPHFVRPSVGRSVRPSVRHILLFLWILFFDLTAPAQMV